MRVQNMYPSQVEFRIFRPRNLIVVENWAEEVIVRAARDNFSDRRKRLFIRHLAAEGFIPDRYERLAKVGGGTLPGVRWLVEEQEPADTLSARSRIHQVLLIVLLSSLLLLSLMTLVVLTHH